jgi:hypothetical protein
MTGEITLSAETQIYGLKIECLPCSEEPQEISIARLFFVCGNSAYTILCREYSNSNALSDFWKEKLRVELQDAEDISDLYRKRVLTSQQYIRRIECGFITLINLCERADVIRKIYQEVNTYASTFPTLIDPQTGVFDVIKLHDLFQSVGIDDNELGGRQFYRVFGYDPDSYIFTIK